MATACIVHDPDDVDDGEDDLPEAWHRPWCDLGTSWAVAREARQGAGVRGGAVL